MRTTKEPEDKEPEFTPRNTLLTSRHFWLNGTAIASVLGFTIWATSKLNGIDAKLDALSAQSLAAWRVGHEQEALYQLSRDNPMLKVPDAYGIHSRIK